MDFIPEVEDEFIRESVTHKLDRPLINISNKVCRDSTQSKTQNSHLQISDSLRHTNEVHNEMVYTVDINTNDSGISKYRIKLLRGNTIIVTKAFLKSRDVLDIGYIPIYSEGYINESNNLTPEQI